MFWSNETKSILLCLPIKHYLEQLAKRNPSLFLFLKTYLCSYLFCSVVMSKILKVNDSCLINLVLIKTFEQVGVNWSVAQDKKSSQKNQNEGHVENKIRHLLMAISWYEELIEPRVRGWCWHIEWLETAANPIWVFSTVGAFQRLSKNWGPN